MRGERQIAQIGERKGLHFFFDDVEVQSELSQSERKIMEGEGRPESERAEQEL